MKTKTLLGAAAAAVALAASQPSAQANVFDSFSSTGGAPFGSDAFAPANAAGGSPSAAGWWFSTSGATETWAYVGVFNPSNPVLDPSGDGLEISFAGVTGVASAADGVGWATTISGPGVTFEGPSLTPGDSFSFVIVTDVASAGGPIPGFGATWSATAAGVPESSTWATMALGFAGLAFVRRRARRPAVAHG